MNKKDVSIEYAHIYTNDKIGKEHELSLEILKKLSSQLKNNNQSFVLMVLVDDYSFPDPSFNYDNFILWLTEKGFKPALVFRESQLIPLCDEVVRNLNNEKLKEQLVDYTKAKKYPCSLFIAAWYLLRLGHLEHPLFDKHLYASKLINILPESFKPFEDLGLKIIADSKFSGAQDKVEYSYIEGRLVA